MPTSVECCLFKRVLHLELKIMLIILFSSGNKSFRAGTGMPFLQEIDMVDFLLSTSRSFYLVVNCGDSSGDLVWTGLLPLKVVLLHGEED